MRVSGTGEGLGVVVVVPGDDEQFGWATFAAWYSLRCNLPDAVFAVAGGRANPSLWWCRKLGVTHRALIPPNLAPTTIEVPPTVMAVRHFMEDAVGPSPANSDAYTTFVDCSRCGTFVFTTGINNGVGPPFAGAEKRFMAAGLTSNELRVLELWDQCHNVYASL